MFRRADRRAATCSKSCKMRVYRARQKARQAFEQEQEQAASQAQWARFAERLKRTPLESNRQPPPAPASAPRPPAPPPAEPVRHSEISPLPPREVTVTIVLPESARR